MKLSLSWLRDWVEIDATPEAIADALTHRGFYVEGVETHGSTFSGVVVARVLEVQKHPNADKLTLCRVDGGAGELSVVCGAPNVRADMLVPLATVGAKLPGGLTIKKSKIRGEESQGMLCSARELELSDDHQGIVDLASRFDRSQLTPGRPLQELLGPTDAVLEIEIPFNRPDGLGVLGLAREVRAAFGGKWTDAARTRRGARWPEAPGPGGKAKPFDLAVEDPEGCPRYSAQEISGITIAPSPPWLAQRLESIGQRPINNVVDVTNYVLFELGQPLHAFDLDRLRGPAIRVRRARAGERITTLDGRERELDPELLVIADRDHPVAVAGVMGGAESEVHAGTTRLLLECAGFDPRRVRGGARRLGLATEASKRYERGVDPEIGPVAAARFLELLGAACPGMTLGAAREIAVERKPAPALAMRTSRCTRVIGMPIDAELARRQLESLEFAASATKATDALGVTVPSWRIDVTVEDDLVEEVARANGYDLIPEAPLETGGVYAVRDPRERLLTRARRAMLGRGITEACSTTLLSEREAMLSVKLLGGSPDSLVRLENPTSREHEVLRPNLLAGLLRACAHNLKQGTEAVRLFEIGHGFAWNGGTTSGERPRETQMIAAVMTGPRYAHAHDAQQGQVDFGDAKGTWEAWLQELRVDTPEWRSYSADGWKPGASAEVASAGSSIAWAGTLGQALLREWEIESPVQAFVAVLDPLLERGIGKPSVSVPGRFPPVRRDLAFFVPIRVTHRQLEGTLAGAAGERLASIELFDIYSGPGTPPDMKSMAFALEFQDPERTMTEAEVQDIQDRMVAAVAAKCGGRLREK